MSDETTDNFITRSEAIDRIRAAKGRAMHRLHHLDDLDARESFEMRGRIDALTRVLYLLEEAPDPQEWPADREHYCALAQADQQVSMEIFEADGERDPEPTNHDQDVY